MSTKSEMPDLSDVINFLSAKIESGDINSEAQVIEGICEVEINGHRYEAQVKLEPNERLWSKGVTVVRLNFDE